jgi:prophage maintenance system killer protein
MISLDEILELHYLSVEKYGRAHGLRDKALLKSAVARPF